MIRVLSCALLLTAAFVASAKPDPLTQLNHPVIALGETATLELQVPAYAGSNSDFVAYSINLKDVESDQLKGYAALAIRCPAGFLLNTYRDGAGGVCYRLESTPHPSGKMVVEILNQDGADGLTEWPEGLLVTDLSVAGGVKNALRLTGVRP